MTRIFRVGAVASATLTFAAMTAVHASGAFAETPVDEPAVAQTVPAQETDPQQPEIRFVASEVVQEVPQEPVEAPAETFAAPDVDSLRDLIASVPVDDRFNRELRCLAQGVYFESRGEPIDGQLAVAQVIVNRAASSVFPDDYCSVITQRSQFSFVKGGHIPEPRSGAAWQRAKAIARIAHRGLWDSDAGDSLYFHATHVKPRWASAKTARAKIDRHIFYR